MRFIALLIFFATCSDAALAYEGSRYTYPQPPRPRPSDPMRVYPGVEIPQQPERFSWEITDLVNGKPIGTGGVKVYHFDDFGRGAAVGNVPAGTPITLDEVKLVGKTHYYSLKWDGPGAKPGQFVKKAWVSGLYIKPVAKK
jgi:hypothetical protein